MNGNGENNIPKIESRISLMPPAAMRPGISRTINAAKRAIEPTPYRMCIVTHSPNKFNFTWGYLIVKETAIMYDNVEIAKDCKSK